MSAHQPKWSCANSYVATMGQNIVLGASLLWLFGFCTPRARPQEKAKKPLPALKHADSVECLAFSPDGSLLASGTYRIARDPRTAPDDYIRPSDIVLWDTRTGRVHATFKGHSCGVSNVAFSLDGKTLASRDFLNTVKLWDIESGKERTSWRLPDKIDCIAFSADLKTIATGSGYDGVVKLWDLDTRKEQAVLGSHANKDNRPLRIRNICFSPDGKRLASSDGDLRPGGKIAPITGLVKVWDVAKKAEIASLQGYVESHSIAWSSDSATLASVGPRAAVRIWDVHAKKEKMPPTDFDGRWHLAFSKDGRTLAGVYYTSLVFWDLGNGTRTELDREDIVDDKDSVCTAIRAMALSPNNRTVAFACVVVLKVGSPEHRFEVLLADIARARKERRNAK